MTTMLIVASIVLAFFMIATAGKALTEAKADSDAAKGPAEAAVAEAKKADVIIASGTGIESNIRLAEAMKKHNTTYVELYRDVLSYMPNFFRVRAIQAQPTGDTGAIVQIQGVLYTYQEYADVMLALLRIPGATTVSRDGFNLNEPFVPNINLIDEIGIPGRNGEPRVSSDPLTRFEIMVASSSEPPGFVGVGGYGSPGVPDRGAMPGGSQVNLTVTIVGRNLQTPDPRASIKAHHTAGATAPAPSTPPAGNTASSTTASDEDE